MNAPLLKIQYLPGVTLHTFTKLYVAEIYWNTLKETSKSHITTITSQESLDWEH